MLQFPKKRIMVCTHVSAGDKVWLPRLDNHISIPHPYCKNCGTVKNVSRERAKGTGHYMNVLSEITRYLSRKGGKLTKGQMRLIVKQLERARIFEDTYGTNKKAQESVFVSLVAEHTNLSPNTIESFI